MSPCLQRGAMTTLMLMMKGMEMVMRKTIWIVNSKSKSANREKFMCEMCSSLLKLAAALASHLVISFQIFFLDCCPDWVPQHMTINTFISWNAGSSQSNTEQINPYSAVVTRASLSSSIVLLNHGNLTHLGTIHKLRNSNMGMGGVSQNIIWACVILSHYRFEF